MNRIARYSRSRRRRGVLGGLQRLWDVVVLVFALASVAFIAAQVLPLDTVLTKPAPAEVPLVSAWFTNCQGRTISNCVVDGDTVRVDGVKIRVADIDTPEVFSPKCASEKALGDQATRRMTELLNAGPFEIGGYERDEDQYGRKLRILKRDGRSIGDTLIAEGLAQSWDGARHGWC